MLKHVAGNNFGLVFVFSSVKDKTMTKQDQKALQYALLAGVLTLLLLLVLVMM